MWEKEQPGGRERSHHESTTRLATQEHTGRWYDRLHSSSSGQRHSNPQIYHTSSSFVFERKKYDDESQQLRAYGKSMADRSLERWNRTSHSLTMIYGPDTVSKLTSLFRSLVDRHHPGRLYPSESLPSSSANITQWQSTTAAEQSNTIVRVCPCL